MEEGPSGHELKGLDEVSIPFRSSVDSGGVTLCESEPSFQRPAAANPRAFVDGGETCAGASTLNASSGDNPPSAAAAHDVWLEANVSIVSPSAKCTSFASQVGVGSEASAERTPFSDQRRRGGHQRGRHAGGTFGTP